MDIFHPCEPTEALAKSIAPAPYGEHMEIDRHMDADARGTDRRNTSGAHHCGPAYWAQFTSVRLLASLAAMVAFDIEEVQA